MKNSKLSSIQNYQFKTINYHFFSAFCNFHHYITLILQRCFLSGSGRYSGQTGEELSSRAELRPPNIRATGGL